jgi:hypothetical protein
MSKLAAAEQEQLGDPSGKSSAEYWNDWFQKISPDGKFEWYCDTSEIARILRLYCYEQRKKKEELYIIHPGICNESYCNISLVILFFLVVLTNYRPSPTVFMFPPLFHDMRTYTRIW